MSISKVALAAAIAAATITSGSLAMAGDTTIKAISKSTQTIPPVPPGITAIFGPNAALVVGTVGVPGIVVGTVVIAGVVYSVIVPTSSSTTT
jgi:hypothetical protein